ncbi:AzlC family ABC transporter permease [Laceyella putida]|uniref:AzlC family ABC transporter permease n=1 Tax=Laceyella putida TaxID=110101 RepID=A0ABW2RJ70_9BACL
MKESEVAVSSEMHAEERKSALFWAGVQVALPIAIGYIPIAIAFGVIARQAELTLFDSALMSMLVYAGASQFMAANMLATGAGGLEVIMATLVINLRHVVMGLSLMNLLKGARPVWKGLLSLGVTDESFAVASLSGRNHPAFVAGIMLSAYLAWVGGTLLGGLLYRLIPADIGASMSIALYAMFISLLIPEMRQGRHIVMIAGTSMLINALGTWLFRLESGWSIILATLVASLLFVRKEKKA